jgi:hypothetical protein
MKPPMSTSLPLDKLLSDTQQDVLMASELQDTPLTPTSLNLPSIDTNAVAAQVQGGNFSGLTNQQKFDLLFPNG